ncbi:uncharacterized protein LOC117179643 [Belonocnema kinseyi]|uniref:uncharacterized protein LOC117179643 n=1 Tax=Belonocnema kinseyi TaxID=2817044 RepID=UPI00143D2E5D|nr:uncharacterized protein LOC117179643 [Belonocnema kinseyi]
MSINVTVNGNPVNIRRGRMVLSDLDQIKKNERDRRRRLRLEQVRQQSKEISNRLHERAKSVVQKELSRLEKDGRSEIKQMHDRKILEMQRKYQEDMEDIGQAHLAATVQPDVDAIIESEKRRNRAVALERGREAAQRLKDSEMKEDMRLLQQERLKKVREFENTRAASVAQSKVPSSSKEEKAVSDYSLSDDAIAEIPQENSPKKTMVTKSVSKKSPIKVITKSNVKVVANHSKDVSPHRKTKVHGSKDHPGSSGMQKKFKGKEKKKDPKEDLHRSKTRRYVTKSSKLSRLRINPESEIEENDNESSPEINVNISSTKSSKPSRYNPEDYIHESPNSSSDSDSSSSCTSSMSEDSSYFSDAADPVIKRNPKIPKHKPTPVESKVQLYDHNTRQRNAYERPPGIVERIDVRNEPNAEDLAREVLESESVNAELLRKRKTSAERRGQDALLRERVRRDYQTLLQNLDHLSREERKLKASQVHEPPNLHMSPMRRKDFQMKRQRKMNRAFEGILRNAEDPPYTLAEKIVTLKPQEDFDDDIHLIPQASWQDPPFRDSIPPSSLEKKDSLDELSREEQLLELLQKVERQKRILLREFGANLPSEVFTSSNTGDDPKSESSKPVSPSKPTPIQKPPSSEMKVINVSDHEEASKQKIPEKKKVPKHTEIAVQTSTIESDSGEDKSIQVELDDTNQQVPVVNEEAPRKLEDQNKENRRLYPLEPVVKVVTPENVDSSSSSSIVTDLIINFDKKQVQVTPKRKKKGTFKISRKTSPMVSAKSRSAPGSKASTPVKKSARSAPPSRLPTPKKTQGAKILEARHDLHVNREFRAEIDRFGGVTVDSSTESSQVYSTPNNGSPGKVYRIHTKSSKKTIRIRDASDTTSTSYASPPTAEAAALLNKGLKDSTPILEMLDASTSNDLHIRKSQISPVSTPETPSPRTMRLPSNVPNPEKISRMLRFNQMEEDSRRERRNDRNVDQEKRNRQRSRSAEQKSPQKSMQKCNCKNPSCKLHEEVDDIASEALRNCPEIQKLYEELENVCAERIASLSDLIKKLRNEQQVLPPGVDFSLMTQNDNTSFLQLSPGSLPHDLQDVRNLVENVEAINNQLARTLQESRRIIAGEGINLPKPPVSYSLIEKSPELSDSRSKESIISSIDEDPQITEERAEKGKPKIISSEPVNLNIDKFRVLRSPSKPEGRNRTGSAKTASGHEDVVEQISKEILEQSKSLNKSFGLVTLESLKESDSYLAMKNEFTFENLDSSKEKEKEEEKNLSTRRKSGSPEKKEVDFVPLLAGIPKVSRTLPSLNPRGRPPVTLISGPYRPEITSPVHELSTIVEFDTPDTANRSQASVRSSPSKVKQNLSVDLNSSVSPSKKSAFKNPLELSLHKNFTTSKPSVHVAPLPTHRTPQSTPKKSPTQKSPTQLFPNGSQIPRRKSLKKFDAFAKSKEKSDSTDSSELVNNKEELQFHTIHKDEKSTSNVFQSDEPQRKLTSTSSNSSSALSGISEIASTPSSDFLKCASSPEEMERTLKKFGLGWAITTLKKTREASALSSSSNSDVTPINTARRIISPIKRQAELHLYGLADLSDVSSISIKEASKSTERAVLMKGRTSTPNILNSNSDKSGSTTAGSSSISLRDPNDSLSIPNLFLTRGKKNRAKDTKPS